MLKTKVARVSYSLHNTCDDWKTGTGETGDRRDKFLYVDIPPRMHKAGLVEVNLWLTDMPG
jgi:hypothetical protein